MDMVVITCKHQVHVEMDGLSAVLLPLGWLDSPALVDRQSLLSVYSCLLTLGD